LDNKELLKKISLFSDLDDGLLDLLLEIIEVKTIKKGKIIFWEGDPGNAFYFIKSGKVKISKLSETGREIIIHILGTGDIFAEVTLFKKNAVYPATAEVIEDAVIGLINNKNLEGLILKNPQLALELIRALTDKILSIHERISQLGANDAVERTIRVLLALAEGHGHKTKKGIELCVNITRQDLASFVGTTRETISRIISRLSQAGVLDISEKNIVITNLDRLRTWI
jgi:CRP/FNR family transcriptional regulator